MELKLKVGLQVRASLSYLKINPIPTVDYLPVPGIHPVLSVSLWNGAHHKRLIWKSANPRWLNEASCFYCKGLKWESHGYVSMVPLIYDQEALKKAHFYCLSFLGFCPQNCYQAPKVTRRLAIKARAEQCTKFDNTSFNGYFFTWIPYLRGN